MNAPLRPDQTDPRTAKDKHRRASIATVSGIEFFPLSPNPLDVRVVDVAHALAMKCRYTGHCPRFYSVAEHSVRVSQHLERVGESVEVQFIGLMHDATEAYLPDVASPVKGLFVGFYEIEDRLAAAIAEAFDFQFPFPPAVKAADAEVFRHEYKMLMPGLDWWSGYPPAYEHPPLSHWDPVVGRERFLQRFRQLFYARDPGGLA